MKLNCKKHLNFFKLKCSYLVYPHSTGQTDGNYFDHRKRILNKEKTEYNFYQNKFGKIKNEISKSIKKQLFLINIKKLNQEYNYQKTKDFLIKFIRSEEIETSSEFLHQLITLNFIWLDNLEISYLIRKALDQVDHEDAIKCLIISDINSLSYVDWEEFEWFHHPFYKNYQNKFEKFRRYFKETNMLQKKDVELNFYKLAICKVLDDEKKK